MVQVTGLETIRANAGVYVDKVENDLGNALSAHAADVAAQMQGRAPWHDVTGEARNRLACDVQPVGSGHFTTANAGLAIAVAGVQQGLNFVLHGDSDHNALLEIERGGALAIITPTFYQEQGTIVDIARKVIDQ